MIILSWKPASTFSGIRKKLETKVPPGKLDRKGISPTPSSNYLPPTFSTKYSLCFEMVLGSSWDRLGVVLGSSWDHFGVILGSLWGRLEITFVVFGFDQNNVLDSHGKHPRGVFDETEDPRWGREQQCEKWFSALSLSLSRYDKPEFLVVWLK